MKTASRIIGVIGGMGPWASLYMCECILRYSEARTEQDYPHIILDSNPAVPDRTAAISGGGEDPFPYLLKSAIRLVSQGADILVMACNTAHYWYDRLKQEVECEFVSIVEAAADAAFSEQKDPIHISVGVLATDGTIQAGIYQTEIEKRGMKYIIPDAEHQAVLIEAVFGNNGIKLKGADSEAGEIVRETADHLRDLGADRIIAGCTELPLVLKGEKDIIDPMEEAAQAIVI